jgi:hypothetical protein
LDREGWKVGTGEQKAKTKGIWEREGRKEEKDREEDIFIRQRPDGE